MNQKISFSLSAVALSVLLAACGGGGGGSDSGNDSVASVVLSGQVVDGPIAGAQVCLFTDGAAARTAAGEAICSADTDAQGNYTLSIPRNITPGVLTLIASKGSNIKLASSLGSLDKVLEAAGSGNTITPTSIPTARVTHFTTADFALADSNKDGTVSKAELDAYVSDFTKVQKVATVVKAVIDFGQAGTLLAGQTTNTLSLAQAAAREEKLGNTNKTAAEWFEDSSNAEIVAAVTEDVAKDVASKFSKYRFSPVASSTSVPAEIWNSDHTAGMYCGVDTTNEDHDIEIALDATRRVAVLRFPADDEDEGGVVVANYDPATGAVTLIESFPREVAESNSTVTYYTEGFFKLIGKLDSSTGNIAGTFAEKNVTTWSLDPRRQECTAEGNFTATKL